MFMLTTISDLIQISPQDIEKPGGESLEDNINAKYANKIIQNVGLCICLYDILKASDGLIGHGSGIVHVNVEFRMIMFRPFKGEIILGQISKANDFGMKIRLDFFDDITVPQNLMFSGSYFNTDEKVWTWMNDGQEYFFDRLDWVRVRVEEEHWNDLSPLAPSERGIDTETVRKSPYSITVRFSASSNAPFMLISLGFDHPTRTWEYRMVVIGVMLTVPSVSAKAAQASMVVDSSQGSAKSIGLQELVIFDSIFPHL